MSVIEPRIIAQLKLHQLLKNRSPWRRSQFCDFFFSGGGGGHKVNAAVVKESIATGFFFFWTETGSASFQQKL